MLSLNNLQYIRAGKPIERERFGSNQPKPTGPADEFKPGEASSPGEKSGKQAEANTNSCTNNPSMTKKCLRSTTRVAVNAFHIGVAFFILAGVSLLHGPFWLPIASIFGLQFVQYAVHRLYPDADVMNKKQMGIIAHKIGRNYDAAILLGRSILRKIPFIGRLLEKPYAKTAMGVRKILKMGINFLTKQLIHNTVAMNKLPDSFGGKVWYITKMIGKNLIRTFCAYLGPLGPPIVALFHASDASEFADSFAPRKAGRHPEKTST